VGLASSRMRFSTWVLTAIASVAACYTIAGVASSQPAVARSVTAQTTVSAVDSVTVGERFRVHHTFVYHDSLKMVVPAEFDAGTCRIVSVVWSEDRSDDKIEKTAALTLITLDLEEARLPGLAVEFHTPTGDTLIAFGDEVVIPVRHIAAAGAESRPLKEQWVAPRRYWKWIVAATALIAAAAVLIWWLRRRARRVLEEPTEPRLPADYVALTELTRIEKMNLLRSGEFKTYYSLVTDAVRTYLNARFGVDAMDRTTAELLDELDDRGRRVDKLDDLLHEADLVKFAKHVPAVDAGVSAMSSAREIVVKSTPKKIVPDGNGSADEEGENTEAGATAGSGSMNGEGTG
jgi:hypothetical protein